MKSFQGRWLSFNFNRMEKENKRITLIILDGWGYAMAWGGNAITEARTPHFDFVWRKYPNTLLSASGHAVGLPGHEMGNSEVGHITLGAGRVIHQDVSKINQAIKDKSFYRNKRIKKAVEETKKHRSKLQMIGLLSDGGVHSHINHLFALLKLAKDESAKPIYLHLFLDGRDTPPMSAHHFLNQLLAKITKLGLKKRVKIASISGRYYAMDRDNNWQRTQSVYQTMTAGRGQKAKNALKAVSHYYRKGVTDEFIPPTIIDQAGVIEEHDSVAFFNFRADRARQLTSFILDSKLPYKREIFLKNIFFVSMVPYQSYDLGLPDHPAFPPKEIDNSLAEILSNKGINQFHTAETEKYAHVTYFFNGAREKPFKGEDRVMIPSPKVKTYDLKPEMSAIKVCQQVLKAQKSQKYGFILVNFANPDMVGHTGNLKATIKAVEIVDKQLGKILEKRSRDEIVMITADHGNAEEMIDRKTGKPHTEHTNNPVPFILVTEEPRELVSKVSLAGIAPAILEELNLAAPKEMSRYNIYDKKEKVLT